MIRPIAMLGLVILAASGCFAISRLKSCAITFATRWSTMVRVCA